MYVIPTKGRQVIDPTIGDSLPSEGREVEANQYWLRRVEDGDVTEGKPTVTATTKQKEPRNENAA